MVEFLLALAAFLLAHAIPPIPPVRRRLISWLGRRTYLFGYSVLSLGLLAWLIEAARHAPYIPLWDPATWQAVLAIAVMPFAIWLVIAGLAVPNPLSITLLRADPAAPLASILSITRHPVPWGFLLWAGGHIPANGDVVALILFGGMAALSAAGLLALERRGRRRFGNPLWETLCHNTSVVPLAAVISGKSRFRPDWLFLFHAAAGMAAYLWFLTEGHTWLIGPDPLAWLPW